jgi:hypothetical protein
LSVSHYGFLDSIPGPFMWDLLWSNYHCVRCEVFTAVTMKNGVFWDVTSCSVPRLLVVASVVPSLPILVTLMKEALSPKSRFLQEPYGVTPQKISFFKLSLVYISSQYFGFPCQFSFHQMFYTHLPFRNTKISQSVFDVLSGLSLPTPMEIETGYTD